MKGIRNGDISSIAHSCVAYKRKGWTLFFMRGRRREGEGEVTSPSAHLPALPFSLGTTVISPPYMWNEKRGQCVRERERQCITIERQERIKWEIYEGCGAGLNMQ